MRHPDHLTAAYVPLAEMDDQRTSPYEVEVTAQMSVEFEAGPAQDVFTGSPIPDSEAVTADSAE